MTLALTTYKKNHNTFGGRIYSSDFNTAHCNGDTASKIFQDWRFDEQCRKNLESKDRENDK